MTPVVAVTGFTREARCVRDPHVRTLTGGGVAANLRRAVEAAVAEGAAGIISFGLTGGLAEGLRIGDWVVGDHLSGATELRCDPAWADALHAALPGSRLGGFFADGRMIDTVAEKRALGIRHKALAVDMESHVAAEVAKAKGLPFAIARIVSDEVDHLLPHAITVSMRPDGGLHTAAMLKSLARHPGQVADVAKTMANFTRGFRGLGAGLARLGPRLAFPG